MGKACPTCNSVIRPIGAGPCPTCGQDSDAIRALFAAPQEGAGSPAGPAANGDPAAAAALHASAPKGRQCADCQIDGEACPTCYTAWWTARHPNAQLYVHEQSAWIACSERLPSPREAAQFSVLGWFPGMKEPDVFPALTVRRWVLDPDPIPGAMWMPMPAAPAQQCEPHEAGK